LYDGTQPDFTDFTPGRIFTEEEVYTDIDSPENWTHWGAVTSLWSGRRSRQPR
jgi:hypothetical protein